MKLRKDIPGKLKVLCLRTRTVLVVCQSGIVRVHSPKKSLSL